ncbi:hypothetical protein GA0115259_114082 [Streptomyces sp. MnatMP-M17]|nr:hypothetical protein GA0115259_114082 [Streptomyces sp. MnatMP-M17]
MLRTWPHDECGIGTEDARTASAVRVAQARAPPSTRRTVPVTYEAPVPAVARMAATSATMAGHGPR